MAFASGILQVSLGVWVVTAGDVSLNAAGLLVAAVNVLVGGYYKVHHRVAIKAPPLLPPHTSFLLPLNPTSLSEKSFVASF